MPAKSSSAENYRWCGCGANNAGSGWRSIPPKSHMPYPSALSKDQYLGISGSWVSTSKIASVIKSLLCENRIGGSLQFQAMENKIYTGCFFPADIERGVYHTLLLTADSDVLDFETRPEREKRGSVMKDRIRLADMNDSQRKQSK